MVGAIRGYRVICTVPDKVAPEKIDLLRAYGAEVIVTPTELLPEDEDSYYGVARRLTAEIEGAFSPDQYSNRFNPGGPLPDHGSGDLGSDRGRSGRIRRGGGHGRHYHRGGPLPEREKT